MAGPLVSQFPSAGDVAPSPAKRAHRTPVNDKRRRVARRKSPLRQLDVIEMGSIVDAPDQDAAIVYINLIDATGILGEPPIGRERKVG